MSLLLAFLTLIQGGAILRHPRNGGAFPGSPARERPERRQMVEPPPGLRYWKVLGVLDAGQGRYAQAEPALRQACESVPPEPEACYHQGRVLATLGRPEAALVPLETALHAHARPWRVHLAMALAFDLAGRASEAEEAFRRSVELALQPPEELDPRLHYGQFLYRRGRTAEAAALFRAAAHMHLGSARIRYQLARALVPLDRMDEAILELRTAVELNHRYSEAHLLLARLYRRIGRVADADRHARLAEQTSP